MKDRINYKGKIFKSWQLISYIDAGGNGEVWLCHNTQKEEFAFKLLSKIRQKAYQRFCDEIEVVRRNQDIKGILPIIDFDLPKDQSKSIPWYVMPKATPISKIVIDKSAKEKIEILIPLAETLSSLHKRNISHRDIKPSNILFYNGRAHPSDFGLADYPEKKDITLKGESVGPKWTMAPEMRRNAESADGIMADSYSFAKTLWILLTGQNKGFDGQYNSDSVVGLKNFLKLPIYLKPIDDLFTVCTDNKPQGKGDRFIFA